MNEPVADESASILDGHIVLSRDLARAEHYPAIDVLAEREPRDARASSRPSTCRPRQSLRQMLATYEKSRDLILLGAYERGSDPRSRPRDREDRRGSRRF